MDGHAAQLAVNYLALACMNAHPKAEAESRSAVDNRHRASHGARRTIESSQKTVTHGVDLIAAIKLEVAADQTIVCLQHRTPPAVAELTRLNRRIRNVSEHNGRQDPVECLCTPYAGEELLDLAEAWRMTDKFQNDPAAVEVLRRGTEWGSTSHWPKDEVLATAPIIA